MTYTLADQVEFDLLTVEAWHNSTKFTGDTFRTGKNTQIPTLREELFSPSGTSGSAITDVRSSSSGYSTSLMWGGDDGLQLIAGTDLRYLMQELNDIENQQPTTSLVRNPVNFPVPPSWSAKSGTVRRTAAVGRGRPRTSQDRAAVRHSQHLLGTHRPRRGETNTSYQNVRDLEREFTLFGVFGTAEYDVTDHWTASAGAGFAERPPTLTELYAIGSFMAVLQPGFTFVSGDADLDPERRTQVDIGLRGDYDAYRCGGRMYYAWINDYITYDATDPTPAEIGQRIYSVAFTNTDLATIAGSRHSRSTT